MTKYIWISGLLASTIMGVSPAAAQSAGTAAPNSAQVQQLQQQMAVLQARLAKLEADEEKMATASAAATQTASAPVADNASSSAALKLPSWLDGTTIGGKAYFNVSSIHQLSDGAPVSQNGVQADAKRFYFTVDHKFSKIFSANLTTDFRYGSNGTSNDTLVYVKKAYIQAKLAPEFYVRVGAADLPWVPFVEGVYGYRFIENTLIDRTKYGTSSDYGVHIGGTFGNGLVSYAISAIDGLGYKTRTRNSDTVDLEGRLSAQPVKGLVLAVGGYTGKRGKSVAGQPDTNHRATRFDALAAYAIGPVHVGVEYFSAKDWGNVTSVASDKSSGWSAFGSFALKPKITLFGRYDWVNPDQYSTPAANEHYFNFGVDYAAAKNVDLALVYKRDKAVNDLISTSNGTIGGAVSGTYDEFGVWSQIKF